MAIRYAVANGNWSNTATWNGGTLPTASDDVFANNFTVVIDQNIDVLSLRNTANTTPSITVGGVFEHISGGFTINVQSLIRGLNQLITYNHTSGINTLICEHPIVAILNSVIIINTGDVNITIPYISMGNGGNGILTKNGLGTLNYVGNILCQSTNQSGTSFTANAGIVNITGNILGVESTSITASPYSLTISGATVNITGNVTGGNSTVLASLCHAIYVTSGNLNVVGIVTGGVNSGRGISIISGDISVTGQVNGAGSNGILSTSTGAITVDGILSASSSNNAINCNQLSATININGNLVNTNGLSAIFAPKFFITGTSRQWTIQSSIGVDNIFYTSGVSLGNPDEEDVRAGVVFGADLTLTGTLAVPTPDNVRKGVPTDDTVGTADLTAEDLLDAIAISTNDVAVRLRNVATVQTTGDQIANL